MIMCNLYSLELNFKIGIVKELHKRELISETQMKKAIKIITDKEIEKISGGANEK